MNAVRLRWVAVLLLAALMPGVGELVENTVHLLQEGHLAHSSPDGDEHGPPGAEHGCSGTLHLCHCCVSPSGALTRGITVAPPARGQDIVALVAAQVPSDAARRIDHPPRA
jgi:hypothetical protein